MGFIDKPHRCNVPTWLHGSVAKVGRWWECDHCKRNWQIQARVNSPVESFYKITWISRICDTVTTISWQHDDYTSGSTHPDCIGDTDLCPDNGCKNCQGENFDNLMRGRIVR